MAQKPSERTHRVRPPEGLNLTPMIDMVTNLMFFLMMFASIIPVVIIDAPLPKVASTAEEIKKAKDDSNKLEVMLYVNNSGLTVKSNFGGERRFAGAPGKLPLTELHKYLVELHGKKPNSKELTLMPSDDTTYDTLIQIMDSTRELVAGDAGYQQVPSDIAQKPESQQFNRLFPEVSIGGV